MSGVAVIRYLLATNSALTTALGGASPASRIVAGDIPLNTPMPAIQVTQISGVPRNTVAMIESPKMHTDRVQVSVLTKGPLGTPAGLGYPGVKSLMALVLAAIPNRNGTINGVQVLHILPDVEGPDLSDLVTSLYSQSRDFIVQFKA